MNCHRCRRRERARGLLVCADCANQLVARPVEPVVSPWVKRALANQLPPRAA